MKKALRGLLAAMIAIPAMALSIAATAVPAAASDNGLGATPPLGWSSWSFIRHSPSAKNIEATADAMVSSGLSSVGYQYVNIDDFYYVCPGSQGPTVDQYGRWLTDASKFPSGPNGENGIQVVADYVHSKGLKFGIYVTPGISKQAVALNTPIEGTPYHADDIATTASEKNYNCGGMVGIDYSKPGAQAFVDSWAKEFASWGVDYLKIDGVGTSDIPDIQAWSTALVNSGRPIHLELSNSLAIGSAATWKQLANGWRTGGDIECYCGPGGSSYPLTQWSSVSGRFNTVANWQPYGGPGGFNDYDSIEVGNGANDGLTVDERKTQMSLWAMGASPFILGTDLTNLDPTDLTLLKNKAVLSVDQDAIDASRVFNANGQQVFTKTEADGAVVVALFNTSGQPQTISTSASALGLAAGTDYAVNDLWAQSTTETTGVISPVVPSHGVALYRVRPLNNPTQAPPNVTYAMSGPAAVTGGVPATVTATFTDHGDLAAKNVSLAVKAPAGWTVAPTSATSFPAVETERTVTATFKVTAPSPTGLFQAGTLTGSADYTWAGKTPQTATATESVTVSPPVSAPYRTYSSAADAPALFAESGDQLGIIGAGADLFSGSDAYSTIYQPATVGDSSTIDVDVASTQSLSGFGKAGIIVRNDMTGSGTTPEGVILFASPSGGIQLEWNNNGGNFINSVTPANGTLPYSVPIHLKLERTSASTYTGYYSYDGQGWYTVGTATVGGQADTQDAGVFVTSHATGTTATAVFNGFTVADGAVTPPAGPKSYQAEAPANTLAGGARVASCTACSGGSKVGFVGSGGTLTFNNVTAASTGDYQVTLVYLDGSTTGRTALVSADGAPAQSVSFLPTGDFNTIGTKTITVHLNAGSNTIMLSNPTDFAPDFDRILVAATPSS
jgi:Alpha galactosidase A/Alpha galactosidase C-terminal beta sandwich domain/NPCBM-associated, NEW3 domain of alpha-galactosidase/Carbohydrate binding module (family 6)